MTTNHPDPTSPPSEPAPSLRPVDDLHRLVEEIVMAPGWREALRAAVAAADRENAELRNSLEACRNAGESMRTERDEARSENADRRAEAKRLQTAVNRWCNYQDRLFEVMTSAEMVAFGQRLDEGGWTNEPMCRHEAERDDLRAQLAAAQAQLADAVSKAIRRGDRAGLAEARLEAVRALGAEWISRGTISVYESAAELGELVLAALSAAPQPEPERSWTDLSGVEDDDATPASDEPARWGMASVPPKFRPSGPGPAASGTPDGGL